MAAYVLLSVLYLHGLCLAYGQDGAQGILGPPFLVTNGSRYLNLTCLLGGPVDRYTWFTPPSNTSRCGYDLRQMCIFQPKIEDDNHNVTCLLHTTEDSSRAWYRVNLMYPPQSSPIITKETPSGDSTKHEEVIRCSVTGGKPRVTKVTFYCQNPDLADQGDVISDDGTTVSSDVTVNTSQVTELNVTCTCFAFWEPEPKLYTITVQRDVVFASQEKSNDPLGTGTIAGIAVAVVVVVAIVIIVVIVYRRRRQNADHKENCAAAGRERRQEINLNSSGHNSHGPQLTAESLQCTGQRSHDKSQGSEVTRPVQPDASSQYTEIDNTYDALQPSRNDDDRTYTGLVTSSGTEDDNYLHPVECGSMKTT